MKKLTEEEVRKVFEDLGYTYLEQTYVNSRTPSKYLCVCGKECESTVSEIKRVTPCRDCSDKKCRENNMIKYGVENPNQTKELKEKIRKTTLERYGVPHASQTEQVQAKMKKTNMDRYGCEYSSQSKKVKDKGKKTNFEKYGVEYTGQNEEVKQKIRQLTLEKYGCEYSSQRPEVKDKMKRTVLERYGVEYVLQSPKFQEKRKQTNLERYGVEYSSQNEEVKAKMRQSNIKKYGVVSAMQVKEIFDKQKRSAFAEKSYVLPSGKEIKVQGHEPFCLNELIKNEHISEKDILDGYDKMPIIWYNNNNKNHKYYPDIYIPSKNLIIEVKSDYTYKQHLEVNKLKMEACKVAGYDAEIRIYNPKGVCAQTIRF